MKKSLFYLFCFVLVQFFLSWAVYAAWMFATGKSADYVLQAFGGENAGAVDTDMLVAASAITSVALILLFVLCRWSVMSPKYLRSGQWHVLVWCAVASLGTLIPSVWLQEMLPAMSETAVDNFKSIMNHRYGYFTLCLLAPFVEEMVFRGAILRALLGSMKSRWTAIAISALLFAIIHVNPAQMPHALLIGLLLGWMYARTGSILPGVVLHWVNNTAIYVIYRLFPYSTDMTLNELFGGNGNNVILAVVFSLFILLPALFQLNRTMREAGRHAASGRA